ncbi:MAG: hypothetical protein QM756_37570 [Polyangiaceae bacterium]
MRKEKVLIVAVFLALVAEPADMYWGRLWTPMKLFGWFTENLPVKLCVFEMLCIVLLLGTRAKPGQSRAMRRALFASLGAVVFCTGYGMLRGGWFKAVYTQMHMWTFGLVFALTVSTVLSTSEHFRALQRAALYATLYRSAAAIVLYIKLIGVPKKEMPAFMTTHDDTVLFVCGALILISQVIEQRTRKALKQLIYCLPFILAAIQFNNRRLAWASLVGGLVILYLMLPAKSPAAKRANKWMMRIAPVVAIYVIVGLGRPEKIFAPLSAFSSMGVGQVDPSTKARDNENFGLVVMTLGQPLLGTGFGHEWLEVDPSYTVPVRVFPMYHYIPHNNVNAFFSFTGALGFSGLWMVFPVAAFLLARSYRAAQQPEDRTIVAVGLVELLVVNNQMYGDMGAISLTPVLFSGFAFAAASRMPVITGAVQSKARTSQPPPPLEGG